MVSREVLQNVEVFKGLDDDELSAVQVCCKEKQFQLGDRLFAEGDDATHLWIVIQGQVDLRFELPAGRPTTAEHTVTSVVAKPSVGKCLGWSCFVPPHKMRLSAYCATRSCKVVMVEKEDLVKLFEKDTKLGYLVMSYMTTVVGHRFHQFQDEVAKYMGEHLMGY